MWTNPPKTRNLMIFTREIVQWKNYFLCSSLIARKLQKIWRFILWMSVEWCVKILSFRPFRVHLKYNDQPTVYIVLETIPGSNDKIYRNVQTIRLKKTKMTKSHRKGYKLIWIFDISQFNELICLLGWEIFAKRFSFSDSF